MKLSVWDRSQLAAWLELWAIVVCVQGGFVEPPPPSPLRSLAEAETRLPCHFQVQGDEQVVQVTWTREQPDGTKEQIITAHRTEGHTEFGRFSGRVRFESSNPTANSALVILSTEESDEGKYTCKISTFPSGNFEKEISLTVWTMPISSLDPVVLVEGQSFRVAASCRSVARPPPSLSWDTDLPGQSQSRSLEGGSVSTYYSLHPLRGMNGKRLDCLVWHPSMESPRRLSNHVVVHYPPNAEVTGYDGNWFVGLEKAELRCEAGGNPKPQNITWTRKRGALPDGVTVDGGRLVFGQALRLKDSGVYECVAENVVGVGKADFDIKITEKSPGLLQPDQDSRKAQETSDDKISVSTMLLITVGVAAGVLVITMVLVIILVTRYHTRKNRKLAMELSERREEINTLSRQNSSRGLNSVGTDLRGQAENGTLLRDSNMKHSILSLEDRPIYKGSQSTLCGKRGTAEEVELEYLGRPVLCQGTWRDGRESTRDKEERIQRVESYLKSSNMSLDSGLPSSLVPMKLQQDGSGGPRDQDPPSPLGGPREGVTDGEEWVQREAVLEGDEGNCDTDASSYRLSEALSNHFHYSNGFLRPKQHSNAILLHSKGQIL